jgi:uncharacterized protein (TIGR04551 family)
MGARFRTLPFAFASCAAIAFPAVAQADEPTRPKLVEAPAAATEPAPPLTVTPVKADEAKPTDKSSGSGYTLPTSIVPERSDEVYSDTWWGKTRPVFELHGYFRTRFELWNNFALSRHENAGADPHNLFPNPIDHSYTDSTGTPRNVNLCTGSASPACSNKMLQFTNMRFRMAPELHVSDNLRILSQVDALDNVVFGSTPDSVGVRPSATGYAQSGLNAYAPLAVFSTTQGPPTSGVNALGDSIAVKRVWAEYQTPLGQLRFGRMPNHWGLGMLANAGDGLDSDWQSTVDRIMFISGVKSLDLYFGAMWDYPASGITSQTAYSIYGGQPYLRANSVSVDQWGLLVAKRTDPEVQRLRLAQGNLVVNGGVYATYRQQNLDVAAGSTPLSGTFGVTSGKDNGLESRGAKVFTPDVWLQVLWNKVRFEAEFAAMYGELGSSPYKDAVNPLAIRQFGLATQTEYRAFDDKLRVQFGFGWASGDPWQKSLVPTSAGYEQRLGAGALSTFSFHPDYRIDLIFHRNIMSRVQGSYYFRPSVDYDIVRNANGQRFGIGSAIIWTRASDFLQTPGHKRDLGVEVDAQVYFQSRDGSLNDDPNKVGGFFAMLQSGLFFPLGGLSYLPGEQTAIADTKAWEMGPAFALRVLMGVAY